MTKLTLTLGFALIALLPLATVTGLQCCICEYQEGREDACNCNSNPAKKACPIEAQRSGLVTRKAVFSAAIFGKKARESGSGSSACMIVKGYKDGKKEVGRYLIEAKPGVELIAPATCKMESVPDSEGYTGLEGCACNTDWCNCSGAGQLIKSTVMMFAASLFTLKTTQFSMGDY
jgi:hypothetical protein